MASKHEKALPIQVSVALDSCSPQVQELYALDSKYKTSVDGLWADTASAPGGRALGRLGYAYLVSLFYQIRSRAESDGKELSPEFMNLVQFVRYVGPRPTIKHSLHRLDNDIGYRIGNVEWADKTRQSEVRRTTRLHRYMGRRLTDPQLSELFRKHGHKVSPAALKKQRQRLEKEGLAPDDVTRRMFDKRGVPYATSTDPIEAWDFPLEAHDALSRLYVNLRVPNEPRIKFYRRHLQGQIDYFTALRHNPDTAAHLIDLLLDRITSYKHELAIVGSRLKELHQLKVAQALNEGFTPAPSGASKPKLATQNSVSPLPKFPPDPPPPTAPTAATMTPEPMAQDPGHIQFLIDQEFWRQVPRLPSGASAWACEQRDADIRALAEKFRQDGKIVETFSES